MELTWEGDLAFNMTQNESGNASACNALLRLAPSASQEELDEAFQRDVVEVWSRGTRKFTSNPRLVALVAAYEDMLGGSGKPRQKPRTQPCSISSSLSLRRSQKRPGKLQKLHQLLQFLPLEQRRRCIAALPEHVRRSLEGWMLQHGPRREQRAAEYAAHIWCSGSAPSRRFVAAVHLGRGLHVQSAECKDLPCAARALSQMLRWRARCRLRSGKRPAAEMSGACTRGLPKEAAEFARGVVEAQPADSKLFLRARLRLSGQRLSSPLRADAASAMMDWLQMGCHRGESLHPGGRACPSPELATHRWVQTCHAWAKIWKKRGRHPDTVQKQLSALQAQWRGVLQRFLRQRQRALRKLQPFLREACGAELAVGQVA
ncbi:unnamed protein product [Effrenium voratum]|nr:unnamed protein product [Effrenium voratum]